MSGGANVMRSVLVAIVILSALCGAAAADPVAEGLAFFREYERRSAQFDASLTELYADDALIRSRRVTGSTTREMSFRGDQWKQMIKLAMPVAKMRGDTNSYSNVSARQSGGDVIVTAQRYSELKRYTSPLTLVLRKSREGAWRIVEERSETQP
jgi:ketosteroid isomerase-like protein